MQKNRLLGIWMDHSNAFLMELKGDDIVTNIVISESGHQEEEHRGTWHEKRIHTKEQHLQSIYYKKLGEIIRDYQEVVLFGPTDAKTELLNVLNTDHLFENIKIDVLQCDKMTETQMHTFVKEYFK
jgi:hypothetical protein